MGISSGDIGASYELLVSAELMQRGFDVFRNLSPNGPVDLVVYKDGKLLRVQVKGSPHAFDAEHYDVFAHYDRKRNEIAYSVPDGMKRLFGGLLVRSFCTSITQYGHGTRCTRVQHMGGLCIHHYNAQEKIHNRKAAA